MSGQTSPTRRPGDRLLSATSRVRRPPTPGGIARRRAMVTVSKYLLPTLALALLSSIALWPELERGRDQARVAYKRMASSVDAAQVRDAKYHGMDEKNRPYTVTAATAVQVAPERINLTVPKGDVTLENGSWLMLQAEQGVYMQHQNMLDLQGDVFLYRDDGTTMRTASATIDLKTGAAVSAEQVHAEGPFGTLDAAGFALADKGGVVQFTGPARLVMNGHQP